MRKKITKVSSADRECGIATYDQGDREETEKYEDEIEWVKVAAVDDKEGIPHDKKRTLATIIQNDLDSWHSASKTVAKESDIVVLEYEHGIDHPSQQGYRIISEEVKKRGKKLILNSHTLEFNPEQPRRTAISELAEISDLIFALNRIATEAIVRKKVYGDIPRYKIIPMPHYVRNNLDASAENQERIAKMFGTEKRTTSVSVGLMSPEKGIDKLIDALGIAWTNRKILPEKHRWEMLHICLGSAHPNLKKRLGGEDKWREYLNQTYGRKLDNYGMPWLYCPGLKELIETDLSPYVFVFVDHFLAENEFRHGLILPKIATVTNQSSEQISSGPGAEFGTCRPLIMTHSLFGEQQLLPIYERRGKLISAEERDSGWLVEMGKRYAKDLAEAYGEAIVNKELRNWMQIQAIDKRQEQTLECLTKRKIEIYKSLMQ